MCCDDEVPSNRSCRCVFRRQREQGLKHVLTVVRGSWTASACPRRSMSIAGHRQSQSARRSVPIENFRTPSNVPCDRERQDTDHRQDPSRRAGFRSANVALAREPARRSKGDKIDFVIRRSKNIGRGNSCIPAKQVLPRQNLLTWQKTMSLTLRVTLRPRPKASRLQNLDHARSASTTSPVGTKR